MTKTIRKIIGKPRSLIGKGETKLILNSEKQLNILFHKINLRGNTASTLTKKKS